MTNTIEKRMDHLEDLVEGIAISVKNILDQMVTKAEFNERMDRLEFRFNEHDRRIDILEDKVGLISRKIGLSRK